MRVLVLAGAAALSLTLPITLAIVAVLAIVVMSYQQTIRAYPNGGGSYIVASDNLGPFPGLVAAGAFLIDYVLTVAVSIAAGVAALTSVFPDLFEYRVVLGIGFVAADRPGQPARHPRERGDLHRPGLRLPGRDLRPARLRLRPLRDSATCPPTRPRPPGSEAHGHGGARPPAHPARLLLRLGRPDRHRGGLQRRAGLQAAGGAPRPDRPDPHGRVLRRDLPRDQLPGRPLGILPDPSEERRSSASSPAPWSATAPSSTSSRSRPRCCWSWPPTPPSPTSRGC